jgi:hypothetical protein
MLKWLVKNQLNVIKLKIFPFFVFLFSSLFAAPDSSGWVALERPVPYVEEESTDLQGVWVVFSKQIGKENFTIRFPADPVYRYFDEGMEVSAVSGSVGFRLFVSEIQDFSTFEQRLDEVQAIPDTFLIRAEKVSADTFDLVYKTEKKWVLERLFFTPNHIYTMQTSSDEFVDENHLIFVDSLYVKSQF